MTAVERIDQIIKEQKMSRRKLALLAQIPPSTFQSAMQRKDVPLYMIESISKALEIPVSSFLSSDKALSEILLSVESMIKSINKYDFWDSKEKAITTRELQWVAHEIERKLLDMQLAGVISDDTAADFILQQINKLNETGQQVAMERIQELAKIPDYRKEEQ